MESTSEEYQRLVHALADRYAIEAEIGAGGMATVYRAQDLKHNRKVAVKVLDPELTETLGAERFLREIETAANLTHPHILPLFDSGEANGFLYYVMPYVKGESLRARLGREKQLPVEDAIQITREIASALAYAHDEGVIHRDVKPANILIEAGHAVLADFGVAHAVAEAKDERLTRTGTSLGTPAYMSPEQAAADGELDARSDQYALGCVLYEMLAGHPPFSGAQLESVIRQHLTEMPPPVTRARPSVPAGLVSALERALAKNPADRFRSTRDFSAELGAMEKVREVPSGLGRKKAVIFGGTFFLALAAAAAVATFWPSAPAGPEGDAFPQDRVVVFPFQNLSGDPAFDDLGEATAFLVTDGLSRTEEVRAVPTSAVSQAVAAYGEGAAPGDIATSLQAGTMVTGVITRRGEDLALQAQVADVATQEILVSVSGTGPASDPMSAADDVRGRVMSALSLLLGELGWDRFVLRPPAYEALQAYQRGQRVFMTQGGAAGIPYMEEAIRLDSTFYTPFTFLAAIYGNQGRWAEADSLLAILQPHRHELGRFDARYMEYLLARNAGDNRARLNAARAMSEDDPYTAGYTHGNAAMFEGRPREALAALTSTDPDDPLWREWSAYWARLYQAHFALGQYEEALEAAWGYRERFPNSFLARQYEMAALIGLGWLDEVPALLDDVETMEPTQSYSPGSAFRNVAVSYMYAGYPERGRDLAERAYAWYERANPEGYQTSKAIALYLAGRAEEALPVQRALAEESPDSIVPRARLGVLLALTGDTSGAEAQERWLAELDRPYLHGAHHYWRAAILAHLDRKDEAVRILRQAFSEGRSYNGRAIDPWLMPLWDYEPFEQLVAPKG